MNRDSSESPRPGVFVNLLRVSLAPKEGYILPILEPESSMPYCPDCKSEYEEGVEKCATCGTVLLPGSVPQARPGGQTHAKPEEISTVCVRVFRGPTAKMEADLARNVLDQEGIPCVLPGEVMAEVLPGVDVVQLLVREEDADTATEILKDYFDSPQPPPPDEPSV